METADCGKSVLMAGTCSHSLIGPLARGLNAMGNIRVSALDPLLPSSSLSPEQERDYSTVVHSRFLGHGNWRARSAGRVKAKIRRVLGGLGFALEARKLFAPYDAIHWHGLFNTPYASGFVRMDPAQKLVVSVWGSDLMRTPVVGNYKRQRRMLDRADLITVHGAELKQVLLAKFGWHLAPKVRFALFGAGDVQLEAVCSVDHDNCRRQAMETMAIDPARRIVCVGHNGHEGNQHLAALSALEKLEPDIKQQITIVIPATYGGSKEYLDNVEQACRSGGFDYRLLTEYMSDEQVVGLRHASDVLVFVPISDAMSAALSQTMAAGNLVIAGAWLPYSAKRNAGVHFHELQSLDGLAEKVGLLVGNFAAEKAKCVVNREIIPARFSTSANLSSWLDIYHELLSVQRTEELQ